MAINKNDVVTICEWTSLTQGGSEVLANALELYWTHEKLIKIP